MSDTATTEAGAPTEVEKTVGLLMQLAQRTMQRFAEAAARLERVPGQHDRRVRVLTLTDEGRRVRAELESAAARSSPVMTALSADDRRVLRGLLRKAVEGGWARGQDCAAASTRRRARRP